MIIIYSKHPNIRTYHFGFRLIKIFTGCLVRNQLENVLKICFKNTIHYTLEI